MTLAHSTLTEKGEVTIGTPKVFPETSVLDKVLKTTQKMSDGANKTQEEPTLGSPINKKGFLMGLQRGPQIMTVTKMTTVLA